MFCLEGTVVLDLSRRYPGAFTAMMLADFGADVIKVDPPGKPLPLQARAGAEEERYAAFAAIDRNKRSVILDMKTEAAREVFYRLVERADVLVEGFRPGVMDRLGAGYARLSELNPRLVYCSQSGFGQDGPFKLLPAHDMNYIAIGGALSLVGQRDGQPYLPSNIVADFAGAGMHGALGITLALLAREKTGRGQHVDVAYLDSVINLLIGTASAYLESGVVPKRGETRHTGGEAWAQVFRCKDGKYFTTAPSEPYLWENLCRALGRDDLIPYQAPKTREKLDWVVGEMAKIFETRTRDEWFEFLRDKEACVGPVLTLDETFQHPQVLHRQMIVDVEHPTVGTVKQVGVAIKLSETPGSIRRLGVPVGSDTDSVLEQIGYSKEQIDALRRQGALG